MKKQILYITFTSMSIFSSLKMKCQITIGNIEKTEPKQVVNTPKPKTLDSLNEFRVEEWWMNYKQYFGDYHFYLPPQTTVNNPILYSTYPKKAESAYDNYYKLIGWVKDSTLKSRLTNDKIYFYHTNEFIQVSRYPTLLKKMYLILVSKTNGDSLYWAPNNNGEFILVPYFLKQKQLYEKKYYYYEGSADQVQDLINPLHTIYIEPKSKWYCKEITLLKETQVVNIYGKDKYSICYIFSNDKNETFGKKVNPFFAENRDNQTSLAGKCFITEREFINRENAIKKEQEMTKAKWDATLAKEKQNVEARKARIISEYGKSNADLILNGKVKLGFTREMCVDAWGPLFKATKNINEQGSFETWFYSPTQVLHFKNGVLIQIEQ